MGWLSVVYGVVCFGGVMFVVLWVLLVKYGELFGLGLNCCFVVVGWLVGFVCFVLLFVGGLL